MQEIEKLTDKKNELEHLIQQKRENITISMAEHTDELSMFDQHPADLASDVYEREKELALLELLEYELEQVNLALEKYQQGDGGVCLQCGGRIENKRLERIPSTTLCAACAHAQAPTGKLSEEVIPAADMSDRGETFQVAGYELFEDTQ